MSFLIFYYPRKNERNGPFLRGLISIFNGCLIKVKLQFYKRCSKSDMTSLLSWGIWPFLALGPRQMSTLSWIRNGHGYHLSPILKLCGQLTCSSYSSILTSYLTHSHCFWLSCIYAPLPSKIWADFSDHVIATC